MARGTGFAVLAMAVVGFMGKMAFTPSRPASFGRSAQFGEAAQQQRLTARKADGSMLTGYGPIVEYANALRDAGAKKGEATAVMEDVLKIKDLYADDEFLEKLAFVNNDFNATNIDKANEILDLVKPLKSTVMPKFIMFLAKKMRLKGVKAIMLEYVQSGYFKESVSPVKITSAVRLTEAQKAQVIEKMKVKCETTNIKLIEEVDAGLVSGFKLEWGYLDPVNLEAPSFFVDKTLKSVLSQKALEEAGLVDAMP